MEEAGSRARLRFARLRESALTTLKLFFKVASRQFKHLENPAAPVSRFHEGGCMRVITRDEQRRYLEAAVSANLRDAAELMLETGMRPEEALGLRAKDAELDGMTIFAAHHQRYSKTAVPGKTENAPRAIPLTARARDILYRRIRNKAQAPDNPDSFLFPTRTGHIKSFRKQHDRAVTRAGIRPRCRLYDLRHTFATRAAEAGVELPVLAAILGHADIRMTMSYVHPQQAAKRAAILKFEAAR